MARERTPLSVRFEERVQRKGADECWPWLGSRTGGATGRDYGVIGRGGKYAPNVYAHRLAWELVNGPIPEGLTIDHLCRNKLCVNPAHLEPVTGVENIRRAAKLSMFAAREIRDAVSRGEKRATLARRYGVDESEITRVVLNEIWIDPEYVRLPVPRCGARTATGPCRMRRGWGTSDIDGPCRYHLDVPR